MDFDTIKAANFGTAAERANRPSTLNAKRLAFRYVLFAHNLVGNPEWRLQRLGLRGSRRGRRGRHARKLRATTVDGVSHNRGTTDQQAGTFMHEFGHLLGLRHGGHDPVNCKPNYRSVMSYTRQFAGSPIPNRRLDYSSGPELPDLNEGVLNESSLNEIARARGRPEPRSHPPFFPSADQIVFGPSAWS